MYEGEQTKKNNNPPKHTDCHLQVPSHPAAQPASQATRHAGKRVHPLPSLPLQPGSLPPTTRLTHTHTATDWHLGRAPPSGRFSTLHHSSSSSSSSISTSLRLRLPPFSLSLPTHSRLTPPPSIFKQQTCRPVSSPYVFGSTWPIVDSLAHMLA
jgi:hypothetical protein